MRTLECSDREKTDFLAFKQFRESVKCFTRTRFYNKATNRIVIISNYY